MFNSEKLSEPKTLFVSKVKRVLAKNKLVLYYCGHRTALFA